jgi:NAD+--asparagine ADP-ribosyltransferase
MKTNTRHHEAKTIILRRSYGHSSEKQKKKNLHILAFKEQRAFIALKRHVFQYVRQRHKKEIDGFFFFFFSLFY